MTLLLMEFLYYCESFVFVDVDLSEDLQETILVERKCFSIFALVEYEKLPDFCKRDMSIGHTIVNCRHI